MQKACDNNFQDVSGMSPWIDGATRPPTSTCRGFNPPDQDRFLTHH